MITLIQFPKPKDRLTFSPFCLKLETFLKVARVPYENKLTVSTKGAKKKKMPMILDHGTLIEDSTFIIEHLKQKHGVDLDSHLTNEQKAIAKAFQWLCEKSLVDVIVYFRWVDKANWPKFRDIIFNGAPWLIKATIGNAMSKNIEKTLYKHGIGRFTNEEKIKILHDNLSAISNYLDSKKFFFGEKISSIDATLFAFLVQSHPRGIVPQLEGAVDRYPNLRSFVQRMSSEYWPGTGI